MRIAGYTWPTALWAALLLLPGTPRAAAAQGTVLIRGAVTDSASQQPVVGAQVQVVGTPRGTLTDSDGRYTLSGVPAGAIHLRAQRIGFAPAERRLDAAAGDTIVADFRLSAVATTLGEIVVVGYGTSRRADVTSAVATVSGAEIANAPIAGVDGALQGKAPGVQVLQNAGNPGNAITVRVRGASSLSAGNQPLWVVDGVPIQSEDFSQLDMGGQTLTGVTGLNPDEIESITVLKDAAASAIYGSRGSNGVVMITTKRGHAGKATFNISAYTGWQKVSKTVPMLNAEQYVEFMGEAFRNDGYDSDEWGYTPGVNDQFYTDWQSEIYRTAPIRDVSLGVGGGSERLRYHLSGSYFDQQGIVIGSAYNRASTRLNMDFDPTSRLSLQSSIALSRERNSRGCSDNTTSGQVTNALGNPPNVPLRRAEDGAYTGTGDGLEYPNSVALAEYNNSPAISDRALGSVEAQLAITGGLTLHGRVGADLMNLRELQWQSPLVEGHYASGAGGVAKSGYSLGNRYVLESFLTYEKTIADEHRLTLTGGTSAEWNKWEYNFIRGEGFSSDQFRYVGNAANVTEFDGGSTGNNLLSFFSRANYSLRDRYFLTASLRTDGSSRFSENHRYAIFPAASVGWLISDEPFLGDFGQRLGSLKLRASYGFSGNQGISDYFASLGAFGSGNYGSLPGTAPKRLSNPDLKWESTREFDVGFDWELFDGRLGIIADYYHKKTSDLLVSRPIPSMTGYSSIWDNIGGIENRGFELALSTVNIRSAANDGFQWRTEFNVAHNKNTATGLYNGDPSTPGRPGINRVELGQPLGAFYAFKFLGVDPETGDAMFFDRDGDGEITAEDRMIVGSPHPKYFGGLTNTFSFKGLELRGFLQFNQGNQIYNALYLYANDGGYYYDNKLASVMNRWQKPGDITNVPRASADDESGSRMVSSRSIENGSYVRLQELTLGYTLPEKLSGAAGARNTQIYISGRNLHTWTKYSGYNPDVNSAGGNANISLGTDFYAYPLARSWMIGIKSDW
jgi:TonB-linked SusC/RagA family outer membrane protein